MSTMEGWNRLLLGAIAMGCFICAVFFLRFWRDGRDRFFLLFAASFFVEGVNRLVLGASSRPSEGAPAVYLVRLLAFLLILAAILDKNQSIRRSRPD
jgi:uncharacterized membrane protein HdeD (DUF308 family)